jgi:hypothetical protein
MAQSLPSSLSPHIVILTSPDLDEVLKNASLPSLPHILQSFSPLPQGRSALSIHLHDSINCVVTTRTTSLVSVPHTSFALRFSDLIETEEACREDDDRRAERALDWITARISHRCAKWVQEIEKVGDKDAVRTPWWDELRRCIEGDSVPSKFEGWNHPVARTLFSSFKSSSFDMRAPQSYLPCLRPHPIHCKPLPLCIRETYSCRPGSTEASCDTP